ncbi:acyl-CoA dehydrogenase family protein [Brackiella oedipodis]|uniref:acyl-CoA dehydrogenase family protein n=1 Tax=Brackiella oedipodis TaxID=124225 RepID=UPI00048FF076|nr:acyl-CoA dehydrogenase [Brackiella oedipodis]
MLYTDYPSARSQQIAQQVEAFVRQTIIPYEQDPRFTNHGPSEDLVQEMRQKARDAKLMTPHILPDGSHLNQRETAAVLKASGISPLGPIALNTGAPDEGNMLMLAKIANPTQKEHFLKPLVEGRIRSAFFMTEPAADQGAGSDPSMLQTTAVQEGDEWVINGTKIFITGVEGAKVGIIMAKTSQESEKLQATMFLVDLPNPAIKIVKVLDTIDSCAPGGHGLIKIDNLRLPASQVLGEVHQGFRYAQVRLAPARLSHCMRWFGCAVRAQEIAKAYAVKRQAFGKPIIDHEGVGFKLVDNEIELQQCALMIDWCAQQIDQGQQANQESSMTKAAVAEALFRITDRCIQVMGGFGLTRDGLVELIFREVRAFRIYDGPTEVHKWSLAKKLKKATLQALE